MAADFMELTIQELLAGLRGGDFSSCELTSYFLDRIESLEGQVHAFLSLKPAFALAQAARADEALLDWRAGKRASIPALLGLPIAVKDVLCVDGFPCTCGSRILENFRPPFNATCVQRLLDAGVVVVGKTNTDEFAMGSSTENSAYGPTHNPWNLAHVPGGSSGGSAAAVAARMIPAALGTDTGGSVRQPASYCGVTGIKPTYGRVSRYGLVAYGSSLDTAGVLARSAQDVETLLRSMAGFDPRDATTSDLPVFPSACTGGSDLKGLRIGLPLEYFIEGIQPEVETAVKEAVQLLEEHGAQVMQVSLPHTSYALPVYYLIAPAEASANLARFDGVRYGLRVPDEDLISMYSKTRGKGFGAEVKRRIMLGTYALSAGYYDAYYGQAQKVRTLIKQDFEKAFEHVDVIAAPIAPTTAFKLGQHTDDPLAMYLEDVFTLPANLAGVPGLAFPVGFDGNNLPIGMQLMGPQFSEHNLFKTASTYQTLTDFHTRMPIGIK
ncbi:MAG: Asp-tRNA(Asn)/Glu-tRNA(Gln) amidotransferase subunit GatA [Anaerolineaceae bacterium]|jgi:aspartyl-tRNA(Asn)/glutamyl-tRNA(Gln) amidotransferase subunit A|nr:MAG: Asp-tRNA(Asn)/Glu-tRNA(Gln) amidotransferase subunit GatA [Anaerolineaceae bacterium]